MGFRAFTRGNEIFRVADEVIEATHSLSSIVDADRIYVLDRGQLVQEGTHHELMAQSGLYAQLWDAQMQEVG